MRNVLTESMESLRSKIAMVSSKKLVDMFKALQEYRNLQGKKASDELVKDTLRRQAVIERELVRRGYVKHEDSKDFTGMVRGLAPKRIF